MCVFPTRLVTHSVQDSGSLEQTPVVANLQVSSISLWLQGVTRRTHALLVTVTGLQAGKIVLSGIALGSVCILSSDFFLPHFHGA